MNAIEVLHIKKGIDEARQLGVRCEYPDAVTFNGIEYRWPFDVASTLEEWLRLS